MKKIFLSAAFAMLMAYVGFRVAQPQTDFHNPYPFFCDFVAEKIYLSDDKINTWLKTCHSRSSLVTSRSSLELIVKDMNNVLDILKVSHLELFMPSEVKSIWKGESSETGIESEFVDSELVIFKVHPRSPAADASLKKGDIIRTINGEQPNPWDARSQSGIFEVIQNGLLTDIHLRTRSVVRSDEIRLERINASSGLLTIPSFKAVFFEGKNFAELPQKLKNYRRVVVDLRGNSGGNFVAGLRFLSLFMCEAEEIGRLERPKSLLTAVGELPNSLVDTEQLAILDQSKAVALRTYANTNCFKGEVRVLVDGKSASVAEMVSQALKDHRQAVLEGVPSRGHLLVGVWYPMPEIGEGVEISIPEAIYKTSRGHILEGQGVTLDRTLYYDLSEMQSGIDSWVQKALD